MATFIDPTGGRPPGRRPGAIALSMLIMGAVSAPARAQVDGFTATGIDEPAAEHCIQQELIVILDPAERFEAFFECGDELFETRFNALDGVGARVGGGQRFTRVPRADRSGSGEWARHVPRRTTGPNAEACNVCHNQPFDDGAGPAGANVIRNPRHSTSVGQFINRNTPHVFALGALQRLAEEMTRELHDTVNQARAQSCQHGGAVIEVNLRAKNVGFGRTRVRCSGPITTGELRGIDSDLVIKPFQWKGDTTSVRAFNRDASHNELGMQPVELTGDDIDGDGDGVRNELGIGDETALAVYLAAQPRPVSRLELASLGLDTLSNAQRQSILRGQTRFQQVGCADCHLPQLLIDDPVFSEPSQVATHRDAVFPAGQNPPARGVDPGNPVRFDLTRDQPDNVLEINGQTVRLGAFERTSSGKAIVRAYGDLKRHDMGPGLAESIDEIGTGASVWMTAELWGVGSTAPYLHDGRATTLSEAILAHGGEARDSRNAAAALGNAAFADLVAFLSNLVLFKADPPEE